jgi:mRNA-degrading endonuclease YafQ of YafQ-DinJ toxin-antitoxin module
MRTVKYTGRFRRDYKREKAGRHGKTLDAVLMAVVDQLADDATLPHRTSTMPFQERGAIFAIVISSPT